MTKKSKQEKLEDIRKRKEARRELRSQKKREEINGDTSNLVPHVHLADYQFSDDGIYRKVPPYYFTHSCFAKGRWCGNSLLKTFMEEFQFSNEDEAKRRFEQGYVTVNGEVVSADYIVKDLDKIEHRIHRHELPVLNEPISIVHKDENLVVVNKPASIPIHPCGRYVLNSLIYILAKEYKLSGLHIVHRIDRMTSGLIIFGRKYDMIQKLCQSISGRQVKKFYLARVRGRFPAHDTAPIEVDKQNYITVNPEKPCIIQCRAPLGPLHPKFGLHHVLPPKDGGKESYTQFMRLRYFEEDDSSLVLCRIHTGRTHQIRVHLQYLGYPILNDPLYCTPAWGESFGRHGEYHKCKEDLVEALTLEHSSNLMSEQRVSDSSDEPLAKRTKVDSTSVDPDCIDCVKGTIRDPPVESLVLYLHAHRYVFEGWDFSAPLPKWASCNSLPIDYSPLE